MSVNEILSEAKQRVAIADFLREELKAAGFSSVRMTKTPLGVNITLETGRPGRVIGPGGKNIKDLSELLARKFGLKNPQISVVEVPNPMLDPNIIATRIAEAMEKGIKYRRIIRLYLRKIASAGAIGAQIKVQGKLTTERSRFEKFTFGYLPATGNPREKFVQVATKNILLPQGLVGIKVKIVSPNATFPDQVKIVEATARPSPIQGEEGEKGEVTDDKIEG